MKKIILSISAMAIASTMAFAGSAGAHFKTEDGTLGGIVGNNLIFIYKDNKAATIKDKTKVGIMSNMLKKQLCEKDNTRKLIQDAGLQVLFIYPDKNVSEATVISVNSCD